MKLFSFLALFQLSFGAKTYSSTLYSLDVAGKVIEEDKIEITPGNRATYKLWLGTVKEDFRGLKLVSSTYPVDKCDFKLQRPGEKAKTIHRDFEICEWRNREISSSSMTLSVNLREVHDLRTDAYFIMSCDVPNTTLKSLSLDCQKTATNQDYNNQIFRSYFDWDDWYEFDKSLKTWLISLTSFANFGSLLLDGDKTGNMFWVTFYDLLDFHNFFMLWYNIGFEAGYTRPSKEYHVLDDTTRPLLKHPGHSSEGSYQAQSIADRRAKILGYTALAIGIYAYVPQFFIDANVWLAADFENIGKAKTYSTYGASYFISLLTGSASGNSAYASSWTWYYQIIKGGLQTVLTIFVAEKDPLSLTVTLPPLFLTAWRIFVHTQTFA